MFGGWGRLAVRSWTPQAQRAEDFRWSLGLIARTCAQDAAEELRVETGGSTLRGENNQTAGL